MKAVRRTRPLATAAIVAAAVLSGCGADDGSSATDTTTDTAARTASTSVTASSRVTGTSAPLAVPAAPAVPAVPATTVPAAATAATIAGAAATVAGVPTGGAALPTVEIQQVTFREVAGLLPPLEPDVASATHVVELRLRTLEVSVDGGTICLGGGDAGLEPETCAALSDRPGVLTYADKADTGVDAVLTSDQVAVVFERTGGGLTCFNEPVSSVGPLVLWWCEGQFAPLIRFELASGPRYEVTVG